MPGQSSEQSARETLRNYRKVVANVVGALRSAEVNRSFVAFSLEEAIDQAIERIEGAPQGGTRPNRLAVVDRIKQDFDNAIEGIRAMDPDLFRQPDPENDVNTAPEPDPEPGGSPFVPFLEREGTS